MIRQPAQGVFDVTQMAGVVIAVRVHDLWPAFQEPCEFVRRPENRTHVLSSPAGAFSSSSSAASSSVLACSASGRPPSAIRFRRVVRRFEDLGHKAPGRRVPGALRAERGSRRPCLLLAPRLPQRVDAPCVDHVRLPATARRGLEQSRVERQGTVVFPRAPPDVGGFLEQLLQTSGCSASRSYSSAA